MSSFYLVSYVASELDPEHSRITDLDIVDIDGMAHLLSTTRFDGVLNSWNIDSGVLSLNSTLVLDGGDRPGGVGSLAALSLNGGLGITIGGGTNGTLQTVSLGADGSIQTATALSSLPVAFGGFQHGTTLTLGDGTQAIYGGLAGEEGLAQLQFDANGTLLGHATVNGPVGSFTDQISATATARIGENTYLLSASMTQNGITSWAVNETGDLSIVENMGTEQGLWIHAPTAMGVAEIGGITYIVLGAAGSSSLSVMELGADGSMIIREHLLDTLNTRFAGVTSVEIIAHNDQTFVIVGGGDDGVSIYMLLEGGQLVAQAHIADTTEMGLDNISAISARGRGDGLDIFVASSSETGITQLRFDTGTAGITTTATLAGGLLSGTTGNDVLQGHDGDDVITGGDGNDIIRDGAGSDILTGGTGADFFILSADDQIDTIIDFRLGEDTIDLSLWPMLRDISQLTFSIQSFGMEIMYGNELLIVQSADGAPIDYRDLTTADLIGGTRIPQNIEPGYPGPATPPPDLTPDPDDPAVDQGAANSLLAGQQVITAANIGDLRDALSGSTPASGSPVQSVGNDRLTGTAGNNIIYGGAGNDVIMGLGGADQLYGEDGVDIIIAGDGNDIVSGGNDEDVILGREGNDTLNGDDGSDTLMGGAGDDTLNGGNGHDALDGGIGDDILNGGAGDDTLFGDAGADTFVFNSGEDHIADFEQGIDEIMLDADLWTGLTSAADVLFVYGSSDGNVATINFGEGNTLTIENVLDFTTLADDIFLF